MPKYKIEDATFNSQEELIKFCEGLYDETKESKNNLHKEWNKYEFYYKGDHWGVQGRQKKRPPGLSMVTANYVWNIYDHVNASMNQTPVNVRILPLSKQNNEKADILTFAIKGLHNRQELRRKLVKCNHFAMMYQSGWMKVFWDNTLYGDMGDVAYHTIDPYRIYPDPAPMEMDYVGYFFDITRMPVWEVRKRWPKTGQDVKPDIKPDQNDSRYGSKPPGAMEQVSTVQEGVSPPAETQYYDSVKSKIFERTKGLVTVRYLYMRDNSAVHEHIEGVEEIPKEELVEGGDLYREIKSEHNTGWTRIVYTKDTILEFGSYPYLHGELCYNKYSFIEDGTLWGGDFMKHLLDPQDAINRFLSNVIDYIKRATNPNIYLWTMAGVTEKQIRSGKYGQVIPTRVRPSDAVYEGKVPPLSNDIFVALELLRRLMEGLGSSEEVLQGKKPGSVTSGKAIISLQVAAAVRLALRYMGMKSLVENCTRQSIALMQQYYIEPRWVRIKGDDGVESMQEINPEDLQGDWEVFVTGDMDVTSPMEQKFQKMLQFAQIAANIPPENMPILQLLAENFGDPDIANLMNKTMNSQAMQNMLAAEQALEMNQTPSAQGPQGAQAQMGSIQ